MMDEAESLLLSISPLTSMDRLTAFRQDLCLNTQDMVVTPLVSMPLPRYSPDQKPGRWTGVPVNMLWHPLLWIPTAVAARLTDGTEAESDERWAVRIALLFSLGGLFDEVSGTWLDALALANLDSSDPAVLDRVRRWQSGASDPALDAIDLTELLVNPDDPDWAADAAADAMADLYTSAWACYGDSLCSMLDDARTTISSGSESLETMCKAVAMLAKFGQGAFIAEPVIYDTDTWWESQSTAAASSTNPIELLAVVDCLYERIEMIRDTYWDQMEQHAAVH